MFLKIYQQIFTQFNFTLIYILLDISLLFSFSHSELTKLFIFLLAFSIIYLIFKLRFTYHYPFQLLYRKSYLIQKICKICTTMKPDRFYHCKICNKCRWRMDHHCKWINNCIAASNLKLYINLLIYCQLVFLFILWMLISKIQFIIKNQIETLYICIGLLAAICNIFSAFQIYRLLSDQFYSILYNQTLVQTYKGTKGIKKSFYLNFTQIFGNRYIYWFLPVEVKISGNIMEKSFSDKNEEGEKQWLQLRIKQGKELSYYNI